MYTIYEHVSPSGKRYIGQTCQPLSRRWRNGYGYAKNTYFYRAICKYGWDNFEHNTICQCKTLKEANATEAELIAKYKTNNPAFGYNISGGSDGSEHMAESTRKLLSDIRKGKFAGEANPNYGKKHSRKTRKLISKNLKKYYLTHQSVRLGAIRTEEAKEKQSESRKNSARAQEAIKKLNNSKAKKVLCIETGVIYCSTHEVERKTGFRQGNIAAACRGEYAQAYGFHWEYA